jgi:quercetin dioxygenase-like cupin family protein
MADYNYQIRFFEDHIDGGAASLAAAIRVIYVISGRAQINGEPCDTGTGKLVEGAAEIEAGAGTLLARWELVPIATPFLNPMAAIGESLNKRTDFIHVVGPDTGIRLDTVTFPPGTRAYRHTHVSCGIRYILRGALEINSEHGIDLMEEGHAWFEAVDEAVLAIASETTETQFVRMMVLPADYHGKLTITYVDPADDDKPREQINNRLLDAVVRID